MPAELNNRDLRDVLDLGRTVLECRDPDELRRVALELMERSFGCDSANFFLTRRNGSKLDLAEVIARGVTREKLHLFREYYYQFDPFLRHFPPTAPVLTMDQVIPPGRLLESEYYNDFLKPQGIHHQLTMFVKVNGRAAGVIALFRSRKRRNFSRADMMKADLCLSYLAGALEKVMLAETAGREQRAAEALASGLPCLGVLVADNSRELIYSNHEAEKLLGADPDGGRIVLPPETARACLEILDDSRDRARSFLMHSEADDGPVEVRVRLIKRPDAEPMFLITLGSEEAAGDWMKRMASRGVSRREMEVAHLVLQGLTNAEISRRLYISLNTVENHLKAIYRKLAVKNRASLIGLLMGVPGSGTGG